MTIYASTPATGSALHKGPGVYLTAGAGWGRVHEPNPILVEFRRSAPWDIAKAAAIEVRWLSGLRTHPVPENATYDQVDHARRVLSRLAVLGSDDD